jgi:hypothetical protein
MRIINPEEKTLVSILGLILSKAEAAFMIEELELLINGNGNHVINFDNNSKGNGTGRKHIKFILYDRKLVENFDDMTKKLIKYGKI